MSPTESEVSIRPATASDCEAVAVLYGGYVRDSLATFELVAPSTEDWQARLEALDQVGLPFLVAIDGAELVGYALATPWRPRPGYRFTVEDSIYIDPRRTGQGLGSRLLTELIAAARAWGAKQVLAVIADSGEAASPALHLGAGFVEVGRLRQVGFKQGRWVDTLLLQLSL
ncbi:MAG: N-acetyltransferase family protein [Candidatus Dormiibacterota bacterium]